MIEEVSDWENFHKKLGLTGISEQFAEKLFFNDISMKTKIVSFKVSKRYKEKLGDFLSRSAVVDIANALRKYFEMDELEVRVGLLDEPRWIGGNEWINYDGNRLLSTKKQVGGTHYVECKIQPVDFIEANSLGFLEGCVVKRLVRHNKPTGKGKQDIEKAIHELQLLLEKRYS